MALPPSIDVCVATYRRPGLLADVLASLAAQQVEGARVRIVVVDNDREGSARSVVERFRASSRCETIYDIEPVQSVVAARNRALANVEAERFAFIDDDEIAPPAWLATMLAAQERFRADVVFGPVRHVFPDGAPSWAKRHSVFRPARPPTGSRVRWGATANCLVRTAALGSPRQRFDPAYGLTGGEDTDFFYRLHLSGKQLVACDEAEVLAIVPTHRATLDWVHRRSYRSGQMFYRACVGRDPALRRALWCARQVLQLAAAVAVAPLARVVSYHAFTEVTARACRSAGQLAAELGASPYEEYDARRHR